MATPLEMNDYLDEIRRHVCRHCPCCPAGGPDCTPRGRACGVEADLPRLVAAVREDRRDVIAALMDGPPAEFRTGHAARNGGGGRWAIDYLSALLAQAVGAVDENRAERDRLHRRLAGPARPPRLSIAELCRAYEEATGCFVGCD